MDLGLQSWLDGWFEMTSQPELPQYIDSTMMVTARACLQKFYREFVQGHRAGGDSIDLHAGACFAAALEEVYTQVHVNRRPLDEALLIAQARFFVKWGNFEIPAYKKTSKTSDRVWVAIAGGDTADDRGYFQEYAPLTDHVQPYFGADGKPTFEFTFSIPLEPAQRDIQSCDEHPDVFPLHPTTGEPFLYSGRLDMLGTYLSRPIWRDEKTSKNNPNTNSHWGEQWKLRNQFIGYTWALRQIGMDCDGGLVRGIGILKEKIGHAEALVTYSNTIIERWHEQLRRDLWRIVWAYDSGYWDYNLGDACTSYGNCYLMEACQSSDPESWMNRLPVRKWNPLHKEEA